MATKNNRVALVTGANRGIGFETARQLAQKGFHVLLGARDEERGRAAVDKLRAEGLAVEFVKLDVTSDADSKAVAGYVAETFGKLDVLVNNAGIALDMENKASDVPQDLLHKTFDANFFSVIALTQALLPLIRKSDAGRIVNLSSGLGSLTLHGDSSWPFYDVKPLAYNASKTALNAFTVHLAHELRDTSIKVNSADPGWVKTDMGSDAAQLEVKEGAQTGVTLATLGADGPTGGFFHQGQRHPW